jgi:hypothetical protein
MFAIFIVHLIFLYRNCYYYCTLLSVWILFLIYTRRNCKIPTVSGREFHVPKQGTVCISTCVRTYSVCELWLKEHCTCMIVLRHIVAVLWEMFCQDQWLLRGLQVRLTSILCGDAYRPLCMQLLLTSPRTVDACQNIRNCPGNLWADVAVHDETCRGGRWMSWRDISSTYHEYTHSVINHKLNVSGQIFLVLAM